MSQDDDRRPAAETPDGKKVETTDNGTGQTTALPKAPASRSEVPPVNEPTGATTALQRQDSGTEQKQDVGATTAIPRHAAGDYDPQATTALPGGSSTDAAMDVRATATSSSPEAVSFGASSRAHRPGAAFKADEIVSERFKIIGFIAAGGMGEVYEVEDIELKKRIALKTIRPEIARDKDALDRFKREIHLSHQITHQNVCRIFDIFHHTREENGTTNTITFLTMELLRGQTLADRLRHDGPMTVEEALPLIRQMSSALDAAHKVGVVHRDFKTGNVILVPDSSDPSGVRVAVADFGLARSELAADAFYEVSKEEDKMVVGTPAYMAPEQVEAKTITPAADMYALGVVFYEMVTGQLPFRGENPLETALMRLEQPPPSPQKLAPDLDDRWEHVVLRLMDRDPEARWADARGLLDFLDEIDRVAEQRKLKRRFILPAICLVVLAVGAGLMLSRLFAPSHDSVAVLGFKNLTGRPEADWMSTALSEMLVAEMAVGGEMRVVPAETVARVKRELAIEKVETLPEEKLKQIGSNLGTDLVLLGSYLAVGESGGGKVRLVVHVQDTSKGETVETFTSNGTEADLFGLIEEASAGLRKFLSLRDVTEVERGAVRAAFPEDPEARRRYSLGLDLMRRHEIPAARDEFVAAVQIEPDHPLLHSWLGAAWHKLGFDSQAQVESTKALDLAAGLPKQQRREVEARYYDAHSDWDRAAEIYRKMWNDFPDELSYGIELVDALSCAGKSEEAMEVLTDLRKLPSPIGNSPIIDLAEMPVAEALADYDAMLSAANRAIQKGRASGESLIVAMGLLEKSTTLRTLGDTQGALEAAREAKTLFEENGDRAGVAKTATSIGGALLRQSDLKGAQEAYEEALAIRRGTGLKSGISFALNNLANVLSTKGDLQGAISLYEESLAIKEEIGDLSAVVNSLNNLANNLYAMGDVAGAGTRYDQALALARDLEDRNLQILALVNSSELFLAKGQPAVAVDRAEEAIGLCEATGWKFAGAAARAYGAEAMFAQNRLNEAFGDFSIAVQVSQEIGAGAIESESRRGMAAIQLDRGAIAAAQTMVLTAVELSRDAGSAKDEALSLTVLALVQIEQKRYDDAKVSLTEATAAAATSDIQQVEIVTRLAIAKLAIANGQEATMADAKTELLKIVILTGDAGLELLRLEAETILAAVERAQGAGSAAEKRLDRVEREARQLGLDRIAAQAAAS